MDRFARASRYACGTMARIAFGPTGVTYERPEFMTQVAELADRHGCGLHSHLHPRPDEREKARRYLDANPSVF